MGKGENAGNQNCSFSHNVFYPSKAIVKFSDAFILTTAYGINLSDAPEKSGDRQQSCPGEVTRVNVVVIDLFHVTYLL